MTYLKQVRDIISNSKYSWDYYGLHYSRSFSNIFNNPNGFINETFLFAGKKMLMTTDDYTCVSINTTQARAAHSISSFFLGFILADGLLDNCDEFAKSDRFSNKSYPFSYIWYLTCLYHDYGYNLEKDTVMSRKISNKIHSAHEQKRVHSAMNKSPYYYGMYDFRKEYKIRESIWKKTRSNEYCCRLNNYDNRDCNECRVIKQIEKFYANTNKKIHINGIDLKIPMRTSNDISRYFAYRLLLGNHNGCIDHGIAGGVIFFDKIIKNYAKSYLQAKKRDHNICIMEFLNPNDYDHKLFFSFDQLKIFSYISDCIINHNIWKCSCDKIGIYKEFCLDNLIGEKFEKINFYKNPLLFILVMSDILEPYKNLNEINIDGREYNKTEIIQTFGKLNINVINKQIVIKIHEDLRQQFLQKLRGMVEWINIEFEEIDEGFVIGLNKVTV